MTECRSKPSVWAVLLVVCFVAAGCGGEKKDDLPPLRSTPGQDQPPPAPAAEPQQEPQRQQPQQPSASQPEQAEQSPPPQPPSAPPPPRPDPNRETKPGEARPAPPTPANAAKPEPKPESKPESKPEVREEPKPAATPQSKTAAMKDVIVLKGAPLGGVRLEHKAHAERAGNTCTSCHHPSRPEKPLASPQQACSDCHTKTPTPPMKTKYQAAFHNPTAQAGTCITCHKTENAKGKKAPLKCNECHKKENS